MHLEVKVAGVEKQTLQVEVRCDASVGDLTTMLRARLAESRPMCLLFALTKLTCPSETLRSLGIKTGHSLQLLFLPAPVAETPPLNRILVPAVPPGVMLPATGSPAAAAMPTSGAPSSVDAPAGDATSTLRLRFISSRVMELPYDPSMTGMGLKRLLESKGEGAPAAFRLLCAGHEVFDNAGLALQKVVAGSVVDVMRREIPVAPSTASGIAAASSVFGAGRAASSNVGPRRGRFVGLRNQGATCYLNSLLQSLYLTPSLSESIQDLTSSSITLPPLTKALVDLFAALAHSPHAVSTEALTSALRWGPVSRQQDVHEFWTLLCEKLEGELKGTEYASIIERLFQGSQRDYVTCSECETTSYRSDFFQDLKLVVPAEEPPAHAPFAGVGRVLGTGAEASAAPEAEASRGTDTGECADASPPSPNSAPATDVVGALREMLRPEEMCGEDQYVCDCCGRKTDAKRGVQLVRLPAVLALQLKRFRYDYRTGQRVKINTTMRFETTLDMAPFLVQVADGADPAAEEASVAATHPLPLSSNSIDAPADEGDAASGAAAPRSAKYELYAVLVHSGSASFGHYYALIKDVSSSEWYEFNDATVTPIKQSDLQRAFGGPSSSSSAYMLLYRAVPSTGEGRREEPTAVSEAALDGSFKVPHASARPAACDGYVHATTTAESTGETLAHGTKRLRLSPRGLDAEREPSAVPSTSRSVRGSRDADGDATMLDRLDGKEEGESDATSDNPFFW